MTDNKGLEFLDNSSSIVVMSANTPSTYAEKAFLNTPQQREQETKRELDVVKQQLTEHQRTNRQQQRDNVKLQAEINELRAARVLEQEEAARKLQLAEARAAQQLKESETKASQMLSRTQADTNDLQRVSQQLSQHFALGSKAPDLPYYQSPSGAHPTRMQAPPHAPAISQLQHTPSPPNMPHLSRPVYGNFTPPSAAAASSASATAASSASGLARSYVRPSPLHPSQNPADKVTVKTQPAPLDFPHHSTYDHGRHHRYDDSHHLTKRVDAFLLQPYVVALPKLKYHIDLNKDLHRHLSLWQRSLVGMDWRYFWYFLVHRLHPDHTDMFYEQFIAAFQEPRSAIDEKHVLHHLDWILTQQHALPPLSTYYAAVYDSLKQEDNEPVTQFLSKFGRAMRRARHNDFHGCAEIFFGRLTPLAKSFVLGVVRSFDDLQRMTLGHLQQYQQQLARAESSYRLQIASLQQQMGSTSLHSTGANSGTSSAGRPARQSTSNSGRPTKGSCLAHPVFRHSSAECRFLAKAKCEAHQHKHLVSACTVQCRKQGHDHTAALCPDLGYAYQQAAQAASRRPHSSTGASASNSTTLFTPCQ